MNIAFCLYLADLCKSIQTVCLIYIVAVVIILVIGFFLFAAAVDSHDDETSTAIVKVARTKLKLILIPALMALIIFCITPARNTIYLMIGANAAQELAVSETGQKVMKAINIKLDEIISQNKQGEAK